MENVLWIIIILSFLKSILIGSDFSLSYYFMFKKTYTEWYFNRETFKDYIKRKEEEIKNKY